MEKGLPRLCLGKKREDPVLSLVTANYIQNTLLHVKEKRRALRSRKQDPGEEAGSSSYQDTSGGKGGVSPGSQRGKGSDQNQ